MPTLCLSLVYSFIEPLMKIFIVLMGIAREHDVIDNHFASWEKSGDLIIVVCIRMCDQKRA